MTVRYAQDLIRRIEWNTSQAEYLKNYLKNKDVPNGLRGEITERLKRYEQAIIDNKNELKKL